MVLNSPMPTFGLALSWGHHVALAFVTLPCRVTSPCRPSLTFIAPPSCSALPQCIMMGEFFAEFLTFVFFC